MNDSTVDATSFQKSLSHISKSSLYPKLHELLSPHLTSFNAIFKYDMLNEAVANLDDRVILDTLGNKIRIWLEDPKLDLPSKHERDFVSSECDMYPHDCRVRGTNYASKFTLSICLQVNDEPVIMLNRSFGNVPIMVKSVLCHLHNSTPLKLVNHNEDSEELGGYFIINGIEKIIRSLLVTRSNYPLTITRSTFPQKGENYTDKGVTIRCMRSDWTTQTNTLHYLSNGSITLRFYFNKNEYLLPIVLIMRALQQTNDKEIMHSICQHWDGVSSSDLDPLLICRVEHLLRAFNSQYHLYNRKDCLYFIGTKFRALFDYNESLTPTQVGEALLKNLILVHLKNNSEKFNLLSIMIRKLLSFADPSQKACCAENIDSPSMQELLLPGQLFVICIKEKLDDFLSSLKTVIKADMKQNNTLASTMKEAYLKKILSKSRAADVGNRVAHMLATGNLISRTGSLDLQQTSGFSIVADRLNFYRFISHFRSVHRGAFFAEIKTTSVRKLLPESWGFLCPVHTPDGAPCGLLNHLSHNCKVAIEYASERDDSNNIVSVLVSLGMIPWSKYESPKSRYLTVQCNGSVVGWINVNHAQDITRKLRYLKKTFNDDEAPLPIHLEIALILPSNGGIFPGLYLFTTSCRMLRSVWQVDRKREELISSFEQMFLHIAIYPNEAIPSITTHIEISPTNIFSVLANLTPFSDFNQSPRNMYQCQMAKQTMGTSSHTIPFRVDSKVYQLNYGQSPIVRPGKAYKEYGMGPYPNGTNAIVAVISYTGYDMEDAMILNKSSVERGFAHGTVYTNERHDLTLDGDSKLFCKPSDIHNDSILDEHGLPMVGCKVSSGQEIFSTTDAIIGKTTIHNYKGFESAYINRVTAYSMDGKNNNSEEISANSLRRVCIQYRIPRNPAIGDKFSSRHGQKGVCSILYPSVDMPFTETGIVPDIIINPHAFPSRMTIGMFVESMAGKAGALHGLWQDATPFIFSERDKKSSAVDYFGHQLKLAGYHYYGSEPMYSGIMGNEMKADIYIGVVYYQRLRHMVADKFQVRTSGPVDPLTHQPIKGRKRAGGIRFGEMERDSLLGHGTSFLLYDRLMKCSDYSHTYLCKKCGNILGILSSPGKGDGYCKECESSNHSVVTAIPYVFKYLVTELMAMNIRVSLRLDNTLNS